MKKIIFWLFCILLFLVPLILWPFTSEVFEFNKMVLVYILTTLIVSAWLAKTVLAKKIIFRRTILDIPLLVFLGSQLISTIFSIDPRTSWLGYYSRFNGGLLSTICYSLLYWAFVSNLQNKDALKLINYSLLPSASLVSIVAILEHFNINLTCALMGQGWKSCWVQDVQSRVFSTLGQPNWLAAWLTALIPITWSFILNSKFKSYKFWIYTALSVLLFWVMIFTKSRSGYLGFAVAYFVFWGLATWQKKHEVRKLILPSILIGASILTVCLISGTEYTPSISSLLINHSSNQPIIQPQGTALETGGTESGTIRAIVWKGAIQVWLHHPFFGTGVETFAYSYYLYRPAEHNLTSEWDFIYNKAHNEYLNFLANSGTVGLTSYLILIAATVYLFTKEIKFTINNLQFTNGKEPENYKFYIINCALLAGYASLLVTNFFGFSVVPTQLESFLFPAIAIALANNQLPTYNNQQKRLSNTQKFLLLIAVGCMLYVVFGIAKYWYADYLYAQGKAYNSVSRPDVATKYLTEALSLEPREALYYRDLATSYANLALAFNQQGKTGQATQLSNAATTKVDKAVSLSPADVNIKRIQFSIYIMLSTINPNYLLDARDALIAAVAEAPTDAKLYYNLGLTYARTGQTDLSLTTLKKTIDLKANYKEARLAYAYLLIDKKQNQVARDQLNYILQNIDPSDSLTKQTLESIK